MLYCNRGNTQDRPAIWAAHKRKRKNANPLGVEGVFLLDVARELPLQILDDGILVAVGRRAVERFKLQIGRQERAETHSLARHLQQPS
jgi:hypothetical protein